MTQGDGLRGFKRSLQNALGLRDPLDENLRDNLPPLRWEIMQTKQKPVQLLPGVPIEAQLKDRYDYVPVISAEQINERQLTWKAIQLLYAKLKPGGKLFLQIKIADSFRGTPEAIVARLEDRFAAIEDQMLQAGFLFDSSRDSEKWTDSDSPKPYVEHVYGIHAVKPEG